MPENIVIANTTPLISLANIGKLDLLYQPYGMIYIPEAVLSEIKSEPARTQVRASNWIITQKITNENGKKLFSSRLHSGEIEVMLLTEEKQADLLRLCKKKAKA